VSTESVNLVLLQQIGISAAVSGGISALVNHLFTMRQIKKDREAKLIQEQLNVYAIFIYHVLKLLDMGREFFNATQVHDVVKNELDTIFKALDSAVIDKYYLLDHEDVLKLISIRKAFRYRDKEWDEVSHELGSLHRRLCQEYHQIKQRYESDVGKLSDNVHRNSPA
jgi:hypothetical protein